MASRPEGDGPPGRLARELGLGDAVAVGLGAMVGAGVFAAIGPAARVAGAGLLIGLAVAGAVAWCNATSSARLAALHPTSGGAYVHGRERLGPFWGYLAGWGFVAGKTASCAAMALTFASYAWPRAARPLAVAAVVAVTALNHRGVRRTATLTKALLAVVLASLAVVVGATALGGSMTLDHLEGIGAAGPRAVLQAAGLLFFAFAGYARITTLAEEVRDPARTIPRAVPIALGVALVVYAAVATAALLAVGAGRLAAADAPLAAAVAAGRLHWLGPAVRVGATVASLGVLVSLHAGVSRTAFAMGADGHLPGWLAAVHPRGRGPHHAGLAVGAVAAAVVAVADLRGAIGFSSFTVLAYYAIANAAALTLGPGERRRTPVVAGAGLAGCAALALSLPGASVAGGAAVLGAGALVWAVRGRGRSPRSRPWPPPAQ